MAEAKRLRRRETCRDFRVGSPVSLVYLMIGGKITEIPYGSRRWNVLNWRNAFKRSLR